MTNAMFNLEHSAEDKVKVSKLAPTLTRLEDIRNSWDDDFAINQKLRRKFRTEKKEIQDKEVCDGFYFSFFLLMIFKKVASELNLNFDNSFSILKITAALRISIFRQFSLILSP